MEEFALPVRFDSDSALVFYYSVQWGEERVWWQLSPCSLASDFGTAEDCGGWYYAEVLGGYDERFLLDDGDGEPDSLRGTVKEVRWGSVIDVYANAFVADVGLARLYYSDDCDCNDFESTLYYARTGGYDGEEIGTPRFEPSVPAAPDAAPPAALALGLHPNPTAGPATALIALDRPQPVALEVFDLLGRRVQRADLGVLPAGEHRHRLDLGAFPSGIYLVRLTGDAGAATTARLVRR